ncbi:hypothetical protein F4780DRAFT_273840 [Xylariomycetidae sp. FL0641]|nr:hypothetical protein F4780DRAFT_273840 [Xylariomycetidae sp. FL0641]
MAFEQSRDLRSFAHESNRVKDQKQKWSRGSRPSPGCSADWVDSTIITGGSESQRAKKRPERYSHSLRAERSLNIVKPRGSAHTRHDLPQSHSRAKVDAMWELSDPTNVSRSIHDLMPSPQQRRKMSVSDNFLYNFDKAESPGKPLSLDIFVKTNPKETEKFVEKEYEILDNNGDALKGRKARRNLRRKNNASSAAPEVEIMEDDGFELV